MYTFAIRGLFISLWLCALNVSAFSIQVWDEQLISRVRVGITSSDGKNVYRAIVLGAIGPDSPIATVMAEKDCVNESLKRAVEVVTTSLDQDVPSFANIEDRLSKANKDVTPTNLEAEVRLLSDRIVTVMKRGQEEFKYRISICLNNHSFANSFRIGVVPRACENNFLNCERLNLGEEHRFEKNLEWFGRGSSAVVNRWRFVNDLGFPVDQDPNLVELRPSGAMWPSEPSLQTLLTQFEKLLLEQKKKRSSSKASYAAPGLMRLSLSHGRQILLALNAPGRALVFLRPKSEPIQVVRFSPDQGTSVKSRLEVVPRSGASFSGWSDEVARARIKECVKFRGLSDGKGIGECAGYIFSEAQDAAKREEESNAVIANCLTSNRCIAEPTDKPLLASSH